MRAVEDAPVRSPRTLAGAGVILIALAVGGLLWAMTFASFEVWGGLLVAAVLMVIGAPLLSRAVAAEPDRRIGKIIVAGFLAKLVVGTLARYYMAFDVYSRTDARQYADWGAQIAQQLRAGDLAVELGRGLAGTGFTRLVTGVVFTFTGPTTLGGFFVFSFLAFWGLYGFYRAFRLACPAADHRRYALLVFFLPTLVFWPSSIGKDAWMIAALGLTAYGAAKVFTREAHGYPLLAVGLAASAVVRPHIALLISAAVAAGYLRRTRPDRTPLLGPTTQLIGVAVLIVVTFFAAQNVVQHWGLEEETTVAGLERLLDFNVRQTATGGSEFETGFAQRPGDVPRAFVNVLFRPLPTEARNMQQVLTSMEGVLLFLLLALGWRRLWEGGRQALANPYLRAAAVYCVLFILAFATVGNFGILARQRAQLFPLLLVFVAVRPPEGLLSPRLSGLTNRWRN
jgi:hypothetical protein